MATAPEDIHDDQQVDPNADQNAEGGDQQQDDGNGEDSPYAPLAKDMGWTPRDQYEGPAESWKSAEQFIRDGRDIQRETSRELKALRGTVDTMVKTSSSIVEQQVNRRVEELTAKYTKAVEDGDPAEAFKLSREIDTAMASGRPNGQSAPPPEAQDFASRNSAWFTKPGNEYETARAVELSKLFASQGYTDPAVQLRLVEQRMKQEFPQLFKAGMNGKPAPGVNAPGSRSAGASNRQKGFSDMPKAAQDTAISMEDRGTLKAEGNVSAREIYARHYWTEEARKAQ